MLDNGVAVRINDAGREHGQIRALIIAVLMSQNSPTIVLRNEDFGRIARLLDDKTAVSLEFDIRNRTIPEGATAYNNRRNCRHRQKRRSDNARRASRFVARGDGRDGQCGRLRDYDGSGANFENNGVKPRRTIRVALWSGEEQGLLGSQAYVEKHFGSFEKPTANYEKFGGYFNIDSGTGRARGLGVFGSPETAAILREAVAPFADLGVVGVINTKGRGLGGSDHTSFNQAGLPGIGVQQDPIEYGTHTWHTNLDTYERIVEDDVKKAAIVVAAAVYQLAMRDELLPRLKREEMPALPVETPTPTPAASPSPRPNDCKTEN